MSDGEGAMAVAIIAMLIFFGGIWIGQLSVNQESFDEGFDAGIDYQKHYTLGVIDKNIGLNNIEKIEESGHEAYVNGLIESDDKNNLYITEHINVTVIEDVE